MNVDDAAALTALAAYQSVLSNILPVVSTAVVSAQAGPGEAPAPGCATGTPEVIPVSYGGPYQEQFAGILAEVAALSKLRVEIPVTSSCRRRRGRRVRQPDSHGRDH